MVLFIIAAIVVAVIGFIYFKLVYPQQRFYQIFRSQGIPGEKFIPIFGQIFDMVRASQRNEGVDFFYQLAEKHGLTYLFGFGPLTRLVVLDGDLLADVLGRPNCENYRKPLDLVNIVQPIIGVHNLLVSEGKEHERSRRMLNPAFHFTNLKSIISIMAIETQKSIDDLLSRCQSSKPIDLDPEFNALTLTIIASSLFGQSFETGFNATEMVCSLFDEVRKLIVYRITHLISQIRFLSVLPFWGKPTIDRNVQRVNQFVEQVISDRRNGRSPTVSAGDDILDLLLSAVDENGQGFEDEEIRDQALTFLLAGHETTGNLMNWVFYILMTRPDIYQVCLDEIDRILPDQRIPDYEDLNRCQIIEAVIYETLRLYPSAPFFVRQAIRDNYIGTNNNKGEKAIFVPKDSMIVIYCYAVHRRKEYWSNPLEFDYQRWLRDPVTGLKPKLPHPYAFLPFAAGPRNCIGQNFAILEAKVMTIMFLQRCRFELVPGQIIVPEMAGITMRPKYGLIARLSQRTS